MIDLRNLLLSIQHRESHESELKDLEEIHPYIRDPWKSIKTTMHIMTNKNEAMEQHKPATDGTLIIYTDGSEFKIRQMLQYLAQPYNSPNDVTRNDSRLWKVSSNHIRIINSTLNGSQATVESREMREQIKRQKKQQKRYRPLKQTSQS